MLSFIMPLEATMGISCDKNFLIILNIDLDLLLKYIHFPREKEQETEIIHQKI